MFEQFNLNSDPSNLINGILVDNSGLTVVPESIDYQGIDGQASFYDGSLTQLGIDAGVLFTSGTGNPSTENTDTAFGTAAGNNTDEELQVVADLAFEGNGGVTDTNSLEFTFTVDDPNVRSLSFDLIFGSDEFPEFSDTEFVDIAAVIVNGRNVGLFNNQDSQPLSIISENIDAGNFRNNNNSEFAFDDNAGESLPIEYDGISSLLRISAPVVQGENTIKFGVADTGDQDFDSGLFIANLTLSSTSTGDSGSGVLVSIPGTNENDEIVGDDGNNFLEGLDGNDILSAGNGVDLIEGGAGDDSLQGGNGQDTIDGGIGADTIEGGADADILTGSLGPDTFLGTLAELNGDVISDFAEDDRLTVVDANFTIDDITITLGSAILDIDINGDGTSDSTITLEGDFSETDFATESELTDDGRVNTIINIAEETIEDSGVILDLRDVTDGEVVSAGFDIERDALFDNTVDFYQVNADGSVNDPTTGNAIAPEDPGYTAAALASRLGLDISGDNAVTVDLSGELTGGRMYAPLIVVNDGFAALEDSNINNDPTIYFAYEAANSDGFAHIRRDSSNQFSFEDLPNGGDLDFNDLIINIDI